MKQGKVWGTTWRVAEAPGVTVDFLGIVPGGYCSEHRHALKTNSFSVTAGDLEVSIWQLEQAHPDVTILKPGDSMTIAAGLWHRFLSRLGCNAIETCIIPGPVGGLDSDIERRTTGGR